MEILLNIVTGFTGGIVGALITYYFIGRSEEDYEEIKDEDLDRWIL